MLYNAACLRVAIITAVIFLIHSPEQAFTLGPEPITVEATPVELAPATAAHTPIGALTFLSGFVLRSPDKRFGGLSGLALDVTGNKLHAISDDGRWFSAQLHHDASGRLTDFTGWQHASLLTPEQRPVKGRFSDAEAVTRDIDGTFLIAFEHVHRIWRYPAAPETLRAPPRSVSTPEELRRAPRNGGVEAMTVLADGRLLILTETFLNPDSSHKGWLIEAGQFFPVSYVPSPGFDPTDMATLPNGDVLVLERRYTLFTGPEARLQWLSRSSLQAGASLRGEEIARLGRPLPIDNFEGLAVHKNVHGDIIVYLLSDDNYQFFQRTLFLQFRLAPLAKATATIGHKTSP